MAAGMATPHDALMPAEALHLVMINLAGMGHILPMWSLAYDLSHNFGCYVSCQFYTSDGVVAKLPLHIQNSERLRVTSESLGVAGIEKLPTVITERRERWVKNIYRFVFDDLPASWPKPVAVMFDPFACWASDFAQAAGLPQYAFIPSGLATLYLFRNAAKFIIPEGPEVISEKVNKENCLEGDCAEGDCAEVDCEMLKIPGLTEMKKSEALDMTPGLAPFFKMCLGSIGNTQGCFVQDVAAHQPSDELLNNLSISPDNSAWPVVCMGPCCLTDPRCSLDGKVSTIDPQCVVARSKPLSFEKSPHLLQTTGIPGSTPGTDSYEAYPKATDFEGSSKEISAENDEQSEATEEQRPRKRTDESKVSESPGRSRLAEEDVKTPARRDACELEPEDTVTVDYLGWLNSHPEHSVVYVALGSWLQLPPGSLGRVAEALTASGHPILWAYRPRLNWHKFSDSKCDTPDKSDGSAAVETRTDVENESGKNSAEPCKADASEDKSSFRVQFKDGVREFDEDGLPSGLRSWIDSSDYPMLILPWVNQVLTLRHPSVGTFVTHCGWNSCMESLALLGRPIVCLPLGAEQNLNASILVNDYKVGVRGWKGERRLIQADVLQEAIQTAFSSEELLRNAEKYKRLAEEAIGDDGPSTRQKREFLKMILAQSS